MKTKKMFGLIITLALLTSLTSCWEDFTINGNGIPETQTRYATSFDEVSVSGPYVVKIIPGDDYHVEVTAEYNLLEYIITDVDNHKLKIRTRGAYNLHNHSPMEVFITTPNLNEVTLSGSGHINTGFYEGHRFEARLSGSGEISTEVLVNELDAKISGSGKIILKGESVNTNYSISGSGKILSYELAQKFCDVNISGSGDAYVNVEKILDVSISGSGDVLFINTPEIHSKISGSGKVIDDN